MVEHPLTETAASDGRWDGEPARAGPGASLLLNPAQQRALDMLRDRGAGRPRFPVEVADDLRRGLDEALGDVAARLDAPLWVGKFALGRVHGCEVRFLHEDRRPLELVPAILAGTIAHRAIQLSVTWPGRAAPLDLVDGAVERIEADEGRDGCWLRGASPAERAEVLGMAAERVGKFLECFPPLQRGWAPASESPVKVHLAGGKVVLSGRVDLVLGRGQGDVAGKAFVDFKTGSPFHGHVDDLRFYALVEALRLGVPPFRLASCYLDGAVLQCDDVTVELLHTAARRVVDGVRKLVALRAGDRGAVARTGPGCRHCPVLGACAEGQHHVADQEAA